MMKHTMVFLLLVLLGTCLPSTALKNLALRGKATQSSIRGAPWTGYSAASNAIDGNHESNLLAGSCSSTNHQADPWWRVDLLDTYIITSITIMGRGDCCVDEIRGADIYIGNSPLQDQHTKKDVFHFYPVLHWKLLGPTTVHQSLLVATEQLHWSNCGFRDVQSALAAKFEANVGKLRDGVFSEIALGESVTLNFSSRVEGRYVTVKLGGANHVLSLCEVEVYGYRAATGDNLALRGRATQSSVYSFGLPMNAIDGSRGTSWDSGSCSHTNDNFGPWWRLDLLKTHRVVSVSVTNRDILPERINGIEIRIGNSLVNNGNDNPRCAAVSHIAAGLTKSFQCDGMQGRYVNIVVPGRKEYLTLCEVEVYGSSLDQI